MKDAEGTLTKQEKSALVRLTNPVPAPERPTKRGPAQVSTRRPLVVHGGEPVMVGPDHPNLLRGRNRHFGAKLSDPGEVFNAAVEAAVAAHLAERPEREPVQESLEV